MTRLAAIPALTAEMADGQIKRRISRELGSRLAINAVLAEMGRLLPPSASLTALEYSTVDMRLKDAAGPAKLSACPLFADTNMGYSKTVALDDKRREARSFQVSCLMAR